MVKFFHQSNLPGFGFFPQINRVHSASNYDGNMHGGHVTELKMFYLILLLPLLPRTAYQVCLPQYDYMVSTFTTLLFENLSYHHLTGNSSQTHALIYHNTEDFSPILITSQKLKPLS